MYSRTQSLAVKMLETDCDWLGDTEEIPIKSAVSAPQMQVRSAKYVRMCVGERSTAASDASKMGRPKAPRQAEKLGWAGSITCNRKALRSIYGVRLRKMRSTGDG